MAFLGELSERYAENGPESYYASMFWIVYSKESSGIIEVLEDRFSLRVAFDETRRDIAGGVLLVPCDGAILVPCDGAPLMMLLLQLVAKEQEASFDWFS